MKRGWIVVFSVIMLNLFLMALASAEVATSINGEYRLRPEFRDNADFNDAADDTQSFYGQRIRLGVDAKINTDLGAFLQIQDRRNWGDDNVLTDSGEALDFHQAYVTLKNINGLPMGLKAGRQELNYGDQRLVGGFGWSNQGRAFDAIKLMYSHEIADIDLWTAKVVEINSDTDASPKSSGQDTDFYGIYSTFKSNPVPDSNLQAYLLYKYEGATNLSEYTLGARLAGKETGTGIDYTAELAYQFGDNDQVDISAYALAIEGGYIIPNVAWSPRVAIEYDYATGSDDATDEDNTFDNLYPTNHLYYGYMDYQGWMNMSDIILKVSAKPSDKSSFYLAYHILSLAEEKDGWYTAAGSATGTLRAASAANTEDQVGQEIDLLVKHTLNQSLKVEGGISQFFTGDFIKNKVANEEDSTWAYLMGTVSF